jgi:cell division protease FtsH
MKLKNKILLLLAALTCATIADVSGSIAEIPPEVTYAEFQEDLENDLVDEVYLSEGSDTFRYTIKTEEHSALTLKEKHQLSDDEFEWKRTINPDYEGFKKELLEKGVFVYTRDFTPVTLSLWGLVFMGGFGLALLYVMWRMVTVTDIQENPRIEKKGDVKFDDIIGHEEILDDFKFLTKLMQNPAIGKELGADVPKGVLLTGPPGTGKTMLAKAVANEANVPFYQISGADFVEIYVGTGAKRVRELFKEARKHAPCIIFIDEIDAIGSQRGKQMNDTSEHRQTINQLLKEMDGFKSSAGVLVLAATNFPDELDEALTRAGRFDKRIEVTPPKDNSVRKQMFEHYLQGKKVSSEVDLDNLAKQTQGLTGADIKQICNESAIIALSNNEKEITFSDILEAIDRRLVNGNKSNRERDGREQDVVLYHESGHAVVRYLLGLEIIKMTVGGFTSGVGGFVMGTSAEIMQSKKDIQDQITILYGGRCSEEIKFGGAGITVGASADIKEATKLLFNYSSVLCFEEGQPLIDYTVIQNECSSDSISRMEHCAIELKDKCMSMLKENYNLVEILVKELRNKDTLTGEEVKRILDTAKVNLLKE